MQIRGGGTMLFFNGQCAALTLQQMVKAGFSQEQIEEAFNQKITFPFSPAMDPTG